MNAGVQISLHIGQRVRHRDYKGQRVTGEIRGLSVDSDRVLQADVALDAPIVIPPRSADDREVSIWHQHLPAHELSPFDDRDELISALAKALEGLLQHAAVIELDGGHAAVATARTAAAMA